VVTAIMALAVSTFPHVSHAAPIDVCLFDTLVVDTSLGNSPFTLAGGSISHA
jgi:hypothetical protein